MARSDPLGEFGARAQSGRAPGMPEVELSLLQPAECGAMPRHGLSFAARAPLDRCRTAFPQGGA